MQLAYQPFGFIKDHVGKKDTKVLDVRRSKTAFLKIFNYYQMFRLTYQVPLVHLMLPLLHVPCKQKAWLLHWYVELENLSYQHLHHSLKKNKKKSLFLFSHCLPTKWRWTITNEEDERASRQRLFFFVQKLAKNLSPCEILFVHVTAYVQERISLLIWNRPSIVSILAKVLRWTYRTPKSAS